METSDARKRREARENAARPAPVDRWTHHDPTVRALISQARIDAYDMGVSVGIRLSKAIREAGL